MVRELVSQVLLVGGPKKVEKRWFRSRFHRKDPLRDATRHDDRSVPRRVPTRANKHGNTGGDWKRSRDVTWMTPLPPSGPRASEIVKGECFISLGPLALVRPSA